MEKRLELFIGNSYNELEPNQAQEEIVLAKKKKSKISVWSFSLSGCFLKELKLWVVL